MTITQKPFLVLEVGFWLPGYLLLAAEGLAVGVDMVGMGCSG